MSSKKLDLRDIYDKNINFLIGSGASHGLFPTLALAIKGETEKRVTVETLATEFEKNELRKTLLFMHYYKECVEPVLLFDIEKEANNKVIENYERFLKTILSIIQRRKNNKVCNIFTTNYDGCISHVADNLLNNGLEEFILNDGARGFSRRYLHAKNFNSIVKQSGVFGRYSTEISQINLIHLHGSVYWYKDTNSIRVDYSREYKKRTIDNELISKAGAFSTFLKDSSKKTSDLPEVQLSPEEQKFFWDKYNELPIVNPTKWKFYETVFEEHYYQMLRYMSYELERENTIFLTFGFSFADEHILNLVKRSLTNPSLQIYVCCFNEVEKTNLSKEFERFQNVTYLGVDGLLDFSRFNDEIFNIDKKKKEEPVEEVEGQES